MVAGHLREKNGYFHIVLSYTDENGQRKTPSRSTGLPVKGNKKRAEVLLREARREMEDELNRRVEEKVIPPLKTGDGSLSVFTHTFSYLFYTFFF